MHFRAKALLCAITCLAAVLTAATLAQAVDQTAKNGCTSPLSYEASLTSPSFNSSSGSPVVTFQGWFEVESIAPGAFDTNHRRVQHRPWGTGRATGLAIHGRADRPAG